MSHQSDNQISVSHPSDNHKSVSHPSDNHKSVSHQSDNQKSVSHQSDNQISVSHPSDNHKSVSHQSDNHKSVSHQSDNHKSDNHKATSHNPTAQGLEGAHCHCANGHFTCAALPRAVSTADRLPSLSDWLVVAEQVQTTCCPRPRHPHEAGHSLYKLLGTQRLHTATNRHEHTRKIRHRELF